MEEPPKSGEIICRNYRYTRMEQNGIMDMVLKNVENCAKRWRRKDGKKVGVSCAVHTAYAGTGTGAGTGERLGGGK